MRQFQAFKMESSPLLLKETLVLSLVLASLHSLGVPSGEVKFRLKKRDFDNYDIVIIITRIFLDTLTLWELECL